MMNVEEMRTLRVLHLPPDVSDQSRDELFKQKYGAVKTRTIRKSAKYTITFVEFPTHQNAVDACHQLHQLLVQDHLLSVEFSKRNVSDDKENITISEPKPLPERDEDALKRKYYEEFVKKWNSWAPYHLVTQPIPPHLKYKYPKPTRETLLRIAIQMIKVPPLYTQVLHLMNKMNIPPPFEGLDEEFPSVKAAYDVENYQDLFGFRSGPTLDTSNGDAEPEPKATEEAVEEEDTDEESEIESDKESGNPMEVLIPVKRKMPPKKKIRKFPKLLQPTSAVPSTSKKFKPKEVFDLRHGNPLDRKTLVVKPVEPTSKLSKKVVEVSTQPDITVVPSEVEGFGLILPSNKNEQEEAEKEEPKEDFITTEQLHDNRISANDRDVLPVFKNYHPGKPSCRLYIKNLAKQVEESDLHFIYRRYVLPKSKNEESEYNVRLMQEGRMKGQAFVTLPNIAQAQLALEETNGYILKDKPMVVQFAKVPKS
ncbi:RNA-binding region-containing protein 3 [Nasonia vitripennis]|uniref:RNA-binding region-containing protein 3 n=1 Tax=Nasonia vitripennis TaxID=7425 RepID=A0A7M7G753_NASVI|nr:RNA-binding region-containing protein 3 [Nasonia vitripennis]